MQVDNNRNVAKKNISQSFRGILRVSPYDNNDDGGMISDTPLPIADSMGNETTIKVCPERTVLHTHTRLQGDVYIGEEEVDTDCAKITTDHPEYQDILMGDPDKNYSLYNLRKYIDSYIKSFIEENFVMEQLVPVGTIIWTAMSRPTRDLHLLPEEYRDWYLFCDGAQLPGQKYPELCKLINGSVTTTFHLPDLRNKFIRGYSWTQTEVNDATEGSFTIPAHMAGTIELPATNMYPLKANSDETSILGDFDVSIGNAGHYYSSGAFSLSYSPQVNRPSHKGKLSHVRMARIALNANNLFDNLNIEARETHPYNITLVPLIKARSHSTAKITNLTTFDPENARG